MISKFKNGAHWGINAILNICQFFYVQYSAILAIYSWEIDWDKLNI